MQKIVGIIAFTLGSVGLLYAFYTGPYTVKPPVEVRGSGKLITRTIETAPFNSVDVSGAFTIVLSEGPTPQVSVEAEDNIQDFIHAEAEDEHLEVEFNAWGTNRPTKPITVHIQAPHFQDIRISGATRVEEKGPLIQQL